MADFERGAYEPRWTSRQGEKAKETVASNAAYFLWLEGETFCWRAHLMQSGRKAVPQMKPLYATVDATNDAELVALALLRHPAAFRAIMKRHNQRLYRLARSIVRDNADAEDVLQEAYLRAFAGLSGFRAESSLATWLSRIVINEALGWLRKKRRHPVSQAHDASGGAEIIRFPDAAGLEDPERSMAQREIVQFVERAADSLPGIYRTVFMARIVEGLSIEETANLLGIKPETVKTRLHRVRKLIHDRLDAEIGPVLFDAFPFAGRRCERVTQAVMARLGLS